jgi:hypothetical protein
MQFADPRATATAYLILRHLYDGDIIEWPVPDDHPLREVFLQLEAQGYVARWDRMWPLHDRYRLTERGIAAIEAVYRPAGAEAFFDDLRRRNLSPQNRRAHLQAHGLNPALWPLLHDPSTHWSTFLHGGARYHSYVWEDQQPPRRVRPSKMKRSGGGGGRVVHSHHDHHHHHDPRPHPAVLSHVVDLDQQANDPGHTAPGTLDYDVS